MFYTRNPFEYKSNNSLNVKFLPKIINLYPKISLRFLNKYHNLRIFITIEWPCVHCKKKIER